jgi:hypothetical protein
MQSVAQQRVTAIQSGWSDLHQTNRPFAPLHHDFFLLHINIHVGDTFCQQEESLNND